MYDEKLNPADVQRFAQNMVRLAGLKGMQVPQPQVVPLRGGIDKMDATMAQLRADNNRIVVFVDDKFQKSHSVLKLAESRYTLLTQHVTKNNAFAFDKTATQNNIMNKFNCKIFGLNYRPVIEPFAARMDLSKSILVLGFDVISAPRASPHQLYTMRNRGMTDLDSLEPSVVGFCGNYADEPHKFVGDYFFQPARRQQLDTETLKNKVAWVLQQYMKPRGENGKPPGLIVIMRDGLSEGQYPMSLHQELPAIREGCKEFRSTYNPKLIYIISTKRHNKRFFGQDNRGVANLQSGSVVDTKVVRADCPEFYMQSHVPIKGTAKIPQYTVPVNEAGVSMDELQAFVNALCHSHQIVNLAISTPEPVYQASELAKRGSNNYLEFSHRHRDRVPRMEDGTINYEKLNTMLSYAQKTLAGTRFTA
ncbi:Piwi domain containing protein [Aphelenchoides avenae]|nr:Piwi domain containing protein [Aphelenchus avenae]